MPYKWQYLFPKNGTKAKLVTNYNEALQRVGPLVDSPVKKKGVQR